MFNKMTEGLVKAWGFIAQANARAQAKAAENKPELEPWLTAVHAKRMLSPAERHAVESVVERIKLAKPEERDPLFAELTALPVKRVRIYREHHKDRSRYTGADIRRLNANGGGPKEKARAEVRRLVMAVETALKPIKDDAPVALAA